ncbi:hypothetical protein B0H17DRAFT_1211944 [Mycena rosella]|uniref:Uncharacterized protein n=1 Tax=Mycena rosella TaxID=1033263 RepID=A0AAD7G6T9_MYCRO|nr:hypothetical protein B0H17DRAFT_1211944 [Mycena rosella]
MSMSSSGGGRRRSMGCLLGLGKPSEKEAREREHPCIHEAERSTPSAAKLLILHESGSPSEYADNDNSFTSLPSSSPSVYGGTACPRMRYEYHFSASTLPSSFLRSSSSHGTGANNMLQLIERLVCPLMGSTSDLLLAGTTCHVKQLVLSASTLSRTAMRLAQAASRVETAGGTKTSLLDKELPGWGPDTRGKGRRMTSRPSLLLPLGALLEITTISSRRYMGMDLGIPRGSTPPIPMPPPQTIKMSVAAEKIV